MQHSTQLASLLRGGAFALCSACVCHHFTIPVTSTHAFSARCLVASQHLAWSILWRFCPKCKNLHVLWLNFMRFLLAPISSLSSSLWRVAVPTSMVTAHPSLVSAANSLRVRSGPSSWSWIKMVNNGGPITDSYRMPLLTQCLLPLSTPLELGRPGNFPPFFPDHISPFWLCAQTEQLVTSFYKKLGQCWV